MDKLAGMAWIIAALAAIIGTGALVAIIWSLSPALGKLALLAVVALCVARIAAEIGDD